MNTRSVSALIPALLLLLVFSGLLMFLLRPTPKARINFIDYGYDESVTECVHGYLGFEITRTGRVNDFNGEDYLGIVVLDGNKNLIAVGGGGGLEVGKTYGPDLDGLPLGDDPFNMNSISARPVSIIIYDIPYSDVFATDNRQAWYEFIMQNGTIIAQDTIDPAKMISACEGLPLVGTSP